MSSRAAYAGLTDAGHSRSHNEDAFTVDPPLYVVADGLGGHQAGEVAAGIAIEIIEAQAPRSPDAAGLAAAVEAANTAIMSAVDEGTGREGMGTTVTAAIVAGRRITLAQVGDSRAYLLRGNRLARATRDHSLVGEMVRQGTLSEQEARVHPNRSVITRALGSRGDVQVDTYDLTADPGDRLLLCSDGLHGMITDPEIERILVGASDAADAVRVLVDAALEAGGLDNVTAVVVEIGADGRPAARPKRRIWAAALWTLAAVALVAAAGFGLYDYAGSRAYLVAEDGTVVVYRGVQGTIAGIQLSWLEQVTDVRIDSLPAVTAERLSEGVPADDLTEAMALLDEYRALVSEEPTPAVP